MKHIMVECRKCGATYNKDYNNSTLSNMVADSISAAKTAAYNNVYKYNRITTHTHTHTQKKKTEN